MNPRHYTTPPPPSYYIGRPGYNLTFKFRVFLVYRTHLQALRYVRVDVVLYARVAGNVLVCVSIYMRSTRFGM